MTYADEWVGEALIAQCLADERNAPAASQGSPVATTPPRTSRDALEEIALIRVLTVLRILAPRDVRVFLERCEYAYHDQTNRKDADGHVHSHASAR